MKLLNLKQASCRSGDVVFRQSSLPAFFMTLIGVLLTAGGVAVFAFLTRDTAWFGSARSASRRPGHYLGHRRPVRWNPLRYGDALTERSVRTHVGQPRGSTAYHRILGLLGRKPMATRQKRTMLLS